MRSLSDYIDDYLYLKDLKKGNADNSYIIHDQEEAKDVLRSINPKIESLSSKLDDVTGNLNVLYQNRASLDAEIDRQLEELKVKNNQTVERAAFETDDYRLLSQTIELYEKKQSELNSELAELKSKRKNAENKEA